MKNHSFNAPGVPIALPLRRSADHKIEDTAREGNRVAYYTSMQLGCWIGSKMDG